MSLMSVRVAALTGTSLLLVACGPSGPDTVVVSQPAPVYTQDGRVIPQPQVIYRRSSGGSFDSEGEDDDRAGY